MVGPSRTRRCRPGGAREGANLQRLCILWAALLLFGATGPTPTSAETSPWEANEGGIVSETPGPTRLEESTLRAVLAQEEFQTSLPRPGEREPEESARTSWHTGATLPLAGGLLRLLLAGLVGILVVFLALHAFRELRERRVLEQGRVPATGSAPAIELSIPLDEIDALARRGEFAAAVRELLHRVFRSLAERQRLALRRAMTSREIVVSLELPSEGREALAQLALTVELSLFGGDEVEESEFRRCRELYQRLEETLRAPNLAPSART